MGLKLIIEMPYDSATLLLVYLEIATGGQDLMLVGLS